MKSAWIIVLLLSILLVGCSGDNAPVNKGKDQPIPPKKDQ